MNSAQIHTVLSLDKCTRHTFKGVYPADQFQLDKEISSAVVVNTDPSDKPGQHWVAFWSHAGQIEFFDSYGMKAKHYFPDLNFDCIYNMKCLQSDYSSCCGQYCIYFIILRSRGHSIKEIGGYFSENKKWNDAMVTGFVNKHCNVNVAIIDYNYVVQNCLNKFFA